MFLNLQITFLKHDKTALLNLIYREDPIVKEVRDARDAHARKFNYNLRAIFEDLKSKRKKWEEKGFEFVTCPPKHIDVDEQTGTHS